MSSWWWRTKPRSIIKTVEWFKEFGKLEGKNWNECDDNLISKIKEKVIQPIRREYIYNAHRDSDEFLNKLTFNQYMSGDYDKKETESNGRNDKTTYEFFGFSYVDNNGIIKITDVGKLIINELFDNEDFLKQLLKLYFPNKISYKKDMDESDGIFPMELLLLALDKYEYLNRSELVLLFGCIKRNMISIALDTIGKFRKEYSKLNKNDINKVKKLCQKIYIESYGKIDNQIDSYYDYAEAFGRSLVYTGLFKLTGRSIASQIKGREYSISKIKLLINQYDFSIKKFNNIDEYMAWFGNPDATTLPWDNPKTRIDLIKNKLEYLQNIEVTDNLKNNYGISIQNIIDDKITTFKNRLVNLSNDTELKIIEKEIVDYITSLNEKKYIEIVATTKEARNEILEKYKDILDNDDMSALWLEVNTWKSLLAITGKKEVKRNFKIEEDLSPKSFAPGVGNTPDMELYSGDIIILPEVSLMSGVRQWEHEASSVIDHVLNFIDAYQNKKVLGLFISTSINIRTNWQFFILNKESWISKPVPVIPITINNYCCIIKTMYDKNININEFIKLLFDIHELALKSENFNIWNEKTKARIKEWINSYS